jgi:hypothetical protein
MFGRRRLLGGFVVALSVGCFVAFGCTDFAGDDVATAPDGAVPDAAASPVDDAAPPDGGASDAAARFCEKNKTAAFCADFDDGSKIEDKWTFLAVDDGGTVVLAPGTGVSLTGGDPSTVLLATTTKTGLAFAVVQVPIVVGGGGIRASADVKIRSAAPGTTFTVMRIAGEDDVGIQVDGPFTKEDLTLVGDNPDGGAAFAATLTSPYPPGRFRLRLDYIASGGKAQVYIDGQPISGAVTVARSKDTVFSIAVGVGSAGDAGGVSAEIDNVLVERL